MNRVLHGKVESFARHYHGQKFHALLCDPPYHLSNMASRYGKNGASDRPGGPFGGTNKGFMGQKWDGGDVAFNPETWTMLSDHLYDGAFGMAFASSRGWHRLACAIEDAGLIIHPSIFGWAFGSGFPKATRIDTQIDKAAGADRGAAATWAGYRYGLQALKPALEPIIAFQKPYKGKPVENITQTGAGALWVDGTRIAANDKSPAPVGQYSGSRIGTTGHSGIRDGSSDNFGRWPANLVLSHQPECNGVCVDGCAVKALGEQSGDSKSSGGRSGHTSAYQGGFKQEYYGDKEPGLGDTGTAARFFFNTDWQYEVAEQLENADPVRYQAKASRSERDAGLDGFEVTNDSALGNGINRVCEKCGAKQLEPCNCCASWVLPKVRNPHPTVKPIALTRWLATLLLPPIAYAPRRILIPFAGVGSEMIGAGLAGWDEIIGIEQDSGYCNIARARLKYAQSQMTMPL